MGGLHSRSKRFALDVSKSENWYRLALSLEYCVKPALLEILHDPANGGLPNNGSRLHAELLKFKANNKNKLRKVINSCQWDVMCPRNGKTDSNDFDITLIVILIRNCCTQLPAPRGGWGAKNLQPNDNSKAANVLRAKEIRNTINHASPLSFGAENLFKDTRKDTRAILQGLGVTDFSEFDTLETACLNHRTEEKLKVIKDKMNCIQESYGKVAKNQKVFQQEVLSMRAGIYQNNLQIKTLETTLVTNNKTTLKFQLILDKTSEHFTESDVKINGRLHMHIVDQLNSFFSISCHEISDSFETVITEVAPLEENVDGKVTSRVRFECKVDSVNQMLVREKFRHSLTPNAKQVVSNIETELVTSIKNKFGIVTNALVRKWEYGSLLIDISLSKIDGSSWATFDMYELSSNIKKVLKALISSATGVIVQQSTVQTPTKFKPRTAWKLMLNGTITMCTNDVDTHIKLSRSSYYKVYHFDHSDAGKIIGKGGSQFKQLEKMPGIDKLSLDTKSSPTHCMLKVEAKTQEACQKLVNVIQKKRIKRLDSSRFPAIRQDLIEAGKNGAVKLRLCDGTKDIPVLYLGEDKILYAVECFQPFSSLEESFSGMSISRKPFQSFSVESIEKTFQAALDNSDASEKETLEFNIIPGKTLFFGRDQETFKTINLTQHGSLDPTAYNLKPIYQPFLKLSLRDEIFKKMEENSFKCQTKDVPESYTTVHLYAVNEKTRFTVRLALDENLDQFEPDQDPGLSPEKKKAIDRVFKATTVSDVLQGDSNPRINYHKLSLLLHPDKNRHPGATEAFKRLQHAYRKTKEKDENWEHSKALVVDVSKIERSIERPKVVSVKTGKKKICSITTFSESTLDLRASLMTYTDNTNSLCEQVKNVLETCWENRDEDGGIPTPDGEVNIYTWCIKQIIAAHVWVKEITAANETTLLEVTVKEMREKVEYELDWENCLEIDMKLIVDGREYKDMLAKDFTNDFLTIKEEWEKICSTL